MKRKPYMLATDLDGTLVGDKEELQRLLQFYAESTYNVALVYITGRHLASALSLIRAEGLPLPDVLISDVGTVIYTTKNLVEDKEWTKRMQTDWQPELVGKLASSFPALSRQPLPVTCRVSFTTENEAVVFQLKRALIENNVAHRLIFSSHRDVDILPKNSGKGQALTYVIHKYACPNVNVLVAGDSGNDLDMLSLGYPSVIVGNAQPELALMESHPQLFRAKKGFAGGIHEAWIHFYGT